MTGSEFDGNGIRINSADPLFEDIYPKQREEAEVLCGRFKAKLKAGSGDELFKLSKKVQILADDVGAGKTWVAMLTLFKILQKRSNKHALIIAPNDLLARKWVDELKFFRSHYLRKSYSYSVERIRSVDDFVKRLRTVQETKRPNWSEIEGALKSVEGQEAFFAYCFYQYDVVTGGLDKLIDKVEKDIDKRALQKFKNWIEVTRLSGTALQFSRVLCQEDAVRLMTFLRRQRRLYGKDWLDQNNAKEVIDEMKKESSGESGQSIRGVVRGRLIRIFVEKLGGDDKEAGERKEFLSGFVDVATTFLSNLRASNLRVQKDCSKNALKDAFMASHHHIFVLRLSDFEDVSNSESERCGLKDLGLLVVDEAHNWKSSTRQSVKNFFKLQIPYECALLVTATPLQLKSKELEEILEGFAKPKAGSCILNLKGKFGKAISLQGKVQEAWQSLDLRESKILEKCAKEFSEREIDCTEGALRKEQYNFWKRSESSSETRGVPGIVKLAKAVIDFRDFLNGIQESLRRYIIKNRRSLNRHVYCGNDVLQTEEEGKHSRLYRAGGLKNDATLLNLICMRMSARKALENGELDSRKPRLLRGWTSSFEAVWASAEWKVSRDGHDEKEREHLESLFQVVSDPAAHPKMDVTVKLACSALMGAGEKTVVFCERKETVKALHAAIECHLKRELDECFDTHKCTVRDICSVYERSLKKAQAKGQSDQAEVEGLWETARVFYEKIFVDTSSFEEIDQKNYDARLFLLIWYIKKKLDEQGDVPGGPQKIETKVVEELLGRLFEKDDGKNADDENPFEILPVCELTGDVSDKEKRHAVVKRFSSPVFPLILVCSPVSEEGVDMHRYCRRIVLHDLSWNPAKLEQRIGRVDRRGSLAEVLGKKVLVYVPFLADSYEAFQLERVLERTALQELYFGRNEMLEEDREDKDAQENASPSKPLADIGPLIQGLFDMDLSTKSQKTGSSDSNPAS